MTLISICRRFLFLYILLQWSLAALAVTATSGTNVQSGTQAPLYQGQICFGGNCTSVASGAFGPFNVTAGTYTVTILNNLGQTILTLNSVVLTDGLPWSFDAYVLPTVIAPALSGFGLGKPYLPCSPSAVYNQTDPSLPNLQQWTCLKGSSGINQWAQSAQGPPTQNPGQPIGAIGGSGAPTNVPCQASNRNQNWNDVTTPASYVCDGNQWKLLPSGGGGGVIPATQDQLGRYNTPGTNIQGSGITTDHATGQNLTIPGAAAVGGTLGVTSNSTIGGTLGVVGESGLAGVTSTAYRQLPSSWNVITDSTSGSVLCNSVGNTIGNDDGAGIQALILAHPGSAFTLPKGPAYCYSTINIDLHGGHLSGLGSNFESGVTNSTAATLKFGPNAGLTISGIGGSVEKFNLLGSKLPAENASQTANLIFPSGANLIETQIAISGVSVSGTGGSQVTTLYFSFANVYTKYGTLMLSGLPSPFTALNGLAFSIQSQCSNIHASCQLFNGGWVTINTPSLLTPVAHTLVSTGTVRLGTTGSDNATGIKVTATGVRIKDMNIDGFAHNCIEINGAGIVADDPILDDVWASDCGFAGYWAHGGDSNAEVTSSSKFYFNQGYGIFDQTFLHGSFYTPQLSYNHMGAQGWSASTPGAGVPINSCIRSATLVTCNTTSAHPYLLGQGIILSGMADATFNSPVVNGVIVSAYFISGIPDSTHFTFQQPIFSAAIPDTTSAGGQAQLGDIQQIMNASGISGGAYYIDGSNDSANILASNLYDEGGQGQGNKNGCGNYFGASVVMISGHFGDCIDPDFYGFYITAASGAGYISPFFAETFGDAPGNIGLLGVGRGYRSDTNSIYSSTDTLGGNTNSPVTNGIDVRYEHPGTNSAKLTWSTVFASDQANDYNHALEMDYGSSASAGESAVTGTPTFTGTGVNDLTAGGSITTTSSSPFLTVICAVGTPDSYAFGIGGSGPAGTVNLNAPGSLYAVGDQNQVRSNNGGNDFINMIITGISGGGGIGPVTSFAVTYPGLNFLPGLNLPTPGTSGVQTGPIRTSSVSTKGINYAPGDTGSVLPGNPGTLQAFYTVDTVDGVGGVLTYHLTSTGGGNSYAVRTKGTTTITGIGSGFILNITAVSGTGMTVDVLTLQGMSACAPIAAGPNTFSGGVQATWASTTGHTLANFWSIPINVTFGAQPRLHSPNGIYISNGPSGGPVLLKTSTSQPSSGYYDKGDWVINALPSAGGVDRWKCLASTTHACTTWEANYDTPSPQGIQCTGTPTAGQVCVATSSTTATWQTVAGSNGSYTLLSWCTGSVSATFPTTNYLAPAPNVSACNGAATITVAQEIPVPIACTMKSLYVKAATAGSVAGSGVITLLKNGTTSALTCTIGTGTSCSDLTHTVAFAAGDAYVVGVATGQAADALSGLKVSAICF